MNGLEGETQELWRSASERASLTLTASGLGGAVSSLNDEAYGCPFLAADLYLSEGRNANQINSVGRNEAAGNRYPFHSLVDSARPHGLHLRATLLPQNSSQRTSDRLRLGLGRNLQNVHDASLPPRG